MLRATSIKSHLLLLLRCAEARFSQKGGRTNNMRAHAGPIIGDRQYASRRERENERADSGGAAFHGLGVPFPPAVRAVLDIRRWYEAHLLDWRLSCLVQVMHDNS